MSRLDEIRKGIESGSCGQCEGAAELLAVVDGMINNTTLESMVRYWQSAATDSSRPEWNQQQAIKRASAWKNLL